MAKTIEEAALAVDDMFNQAFENAGRKTVPHLRMVFVLMCLYLAAGDDSGEDSGDEDDRRETGDEEDGPIEQEFEVSIETFS
jgi:regulator of nonsense transcripts 2